MAYIKLEDVLEVLNKRNMTKNIAINEMKNIPTADFVEVVRCEKCKHGEVSIISKTTDGKERIACYCNVKNGVTDLNSYCPSGERGVADA